MERPLSLKRAGGGGEGHSLSAGKSGSITPVDYPLLPATGWGLLELP